MLDDESELFLDGILKVLDDGCFAGGLAVTNSNWNGS